MYDGVFCINLFGVYHSVCLDVKRKVFERMVAPTGTCAAETDYEKGG